MNRSSCAPCRAEPSGAPGARHGVALIVVLGFLAVLLIMGVGFAVHMRTERMAARHYHQYVAARELVYAGLARAIDTADRSLGDTPFPPWTILRSNDPDDDDILDTVAAEAYTFLPWIPQLDEPPRGTWPLPSPPPPDYKPGAVILNLSDRSHALVRDTERRSPLHRGFDNVWKTGDRYKIVPAAHTAVWHTVASSGPLVQQFSFSVINVSGLLDAHVAGRAARGFGTDPGETQIADLPELQGRADTRDGMQWRRPAHHRYDTQEEFYNLNLVHVLDRGNPAPSLFHFSYFPSGLDRMGFLDDNYPLSFRRDLRYHIYHDTSNETLYPLPSYFRERARTEGFFSPEIFYAPSGWWSDENPVGLLMRIDVSGTNALQWAESNRYRNFITEVCGVFDHALWDLPLTMGAQEDVRTNITAWAFNSLVGYIDDENVPRRLDGPNPSAVPMLNEFAVTNYFALEVSAQEEVTTDPITGISTTNWVPHVVRPTVYNLAGAEAWYPFASAAADRYELRVAEVLIENRNEDLHFTLYPTAAFSGGFTNVIANPAPDTFYTEQRELNITTAPAAAHHLYGFEYDPVDNAIVADYHYDIVFRNIRVVSMANTNVVDRVADLRLTVTNRLSAPVPESTIPLVTESSVVYSLEAVDPRWNWDIENRAMWRLREDRHSLETYNASTIEYLAGTGSNLWILDPGGEQTIAQYVSPVTLSLPPPDEIHLGSDPVMFVANRPLRRVGELGYINYYPWRSFRIAGEDPLHPVVDYFSVNHPRAGFHVRDLRVGSSYSLAGEQGFNNIARRHLSGFAVLREDRAIVPALDFGPDAQDFPGGAYAQRTVLRAVGYLHAEAGTACTFTLRSGGTGGMALYVHNQQWILSAAGTESVTVPFTTTGLFPVRVYYWNPVSADRSLRLEISPDRPLLSGWPNTGYLNPHTPHRDVLAAGFHNLPLDADYRSPPTRGFPAWDDAQAMAGQFMAGGTTFFRPSQIAAVPALRHAGGVNRFERMALVSNLIDMMHLRGQVFVIPVAGRVVNEETGEVIADQRAVAVVWRDPFPDTGGRHRAMVRVFQWLFH